MVPSQEEPAAARGTSEAQPLGSAPPGAAPLPGAGPLDGSEAAAAEKVEIELGGSVGAEPLEPPEGGWGWLVMLAAMWCNGSVFGIQNACGVLFVSMLKTFGSKDDGKMVFKTGEAQRPPRPRRGMGAGCIPRVERASAPPGAPLRVPLCEGCEGWVCPIAKAALRLPGPPCASLCVESRCRDCIWIQVTKLICLDLPASPFCRIEAVSSRLSLNF